MHPTSGRIILVLSLVLSLVVACGAKSDGGGAQSTDTPAPGTMGHLHIVATEGPTCPLQRAGTPECVAPYRGPVEVSGPDGSTSIVTTSSTGTADLDLKAAVYRLSTGSSLGTRSQPVSISVVPGATSTATIRVDTGIR